MNIAFVLPISKHAPSDELTYFTAFKLNPGDIVKIPFGNRVIYGIVRKTDTVMNLKQKIRFSNFSLKKVKARIGRSIFHPEVFKAIDEISDFFLIKSGDVGDFFLPANLREEIIDEEKKQTLEKKRAKDPRAILGHPSIRLKFLKPIIREFLGNKKIIFVVVPTLFDLDFYFKNYAKGIEQISFKLSHAINKKKITNAIRQIKTSDKGLIIFGTPSYLSSIIERVSLIIFENENSIFYKNNLVNFDIRKSIEILSKRFNKEIIYSDRFLSLDIWQDIKDGFIKLEKTLSNSNYPLVIKEIKKNEDLKIKNEILNEEVLKTIEDKFLNKKTGFILSQRSGHSPATICRDCGHIARCPNCKRPFILYKISKEKSFFKCNFCQLIKDTYSTCDNCNGWQLQTIGIGTVKIYEELFKKFPREKIFFIDSTIKQKTSQKKETIKIFRESKGSLLVSTLQYLVINGENIDYTLIPSFDSLAMAPTYRATEKALSILSYLEIISSEILVESNGEFLNLIQEALVGRMDKFAEKELSIRQKIGLAPNFSIIKIKISDREIKDLSSKIDSCMVSFLSFKPEKNLLIFKNPKTNKFQQNIILKLPKKFWSIQNGIIFQDPNLKKKIRSIEAEFEINSDSLF